MQHKSVIVGNLRISYYQSDRVDENNALIFLHGWGSRAIYFKEILDQCDNFLAIDLPGFGGSDNPHSAWAINDYANFLDNFFKKFGIKKPILVGHSFGGSIIIKYCSLNRDIKKIILIDSAGIRQKTIKINFFNFLSKVGKIFFLLPGVGIIKNKIRRSFYIMIGATDYIDAGELKGTYQKVISEDLQADLKKINVKTVLIWGEKDKITPLKDGWLMHKLIKGSKIFIIKNAGHYVFLDNKQEFNNIFFKQIR